MTGGELHDKLMHVGAKAMAEAMVKLEMDDLPLTPQPDEGVLYAAKIDKSETRIDFSRDAADVHNHIRGLAPFPGAWFELEISGKPERVKVLGSERAEGRALPANC
jgi:methionyl-tRNA formyltransferase